MRQVIGPLLPPLIEIGVASPGEIADILDNKAIAIDRRSDGAGDIGRPVPVAGRRYCRPPPEKEGERGGVEREREPSPRCRKAHYNDNSEGQGSCGQKP